MMKTEFAQRGFHRKAGVMSEDELRAAVARSREDGFRALFAEYSGYVYTIVWNRLRTVCTKEDAEECVSDVFAEIFRQFDSIAPGGLHGLIAAAANRRAVDYFRRATAKKQQAAIPEDALPELRSPDDVAADYESGELSALLLETVLTLGEPDATIIVQKYYYGRNSDEIAQTLQMKPSAVRVRLSRALKRLRGKLSEAGITMYEGGAL